MFVLIDKTLVVAPDRGSFRTAPSIEVELLYGNISSAFCESPVATHAKLPQESLNDEGRMILSPEAVLVGPILVIAAIAGLTSLLYAVAHKLNDTARPSDSYSNSGYDDGYNDDYAVHDSEARRNVVCDGY